MPIREFNIVDFGVQLWLLMFLPDQFPSIVSIPGDYLDYNWTI